MLRLTIKEALDQDDASYGPHIYFYREGETIFYIGQSVQPFERLRQHLGRGLLSPGPDAIGNLILDNRPASLSWTVQITPLSEIHAAQASHVKVSITRLERALIEHFKPCINNMGNKHATPLPAKYRPTGAANEGVKLA